MRGNSLNFITRRLSFANFSNRYSVMKAKVSDGLSERVKGTWLEKWGHFWRNICADYAEVLKETSNGIKERPRRALAYAWGFATWWCCVHTNPDAQSFRDQFLSSMQELSSIPQAIRNKETSNHILFIESSYNTGTIRHLNLGALSLMWVDNYDQSLGLYPAQCNYLKPKLFTFHERVVDVGFIGRWWVLSRKLVDCDVNVEEWDN